jgi:hypothetical protein
MLYDRNRSHFAQVQGTPFMIPPLSDLLSFDGVKEFGKVVLSGAPIPIDMEIPQSAKLLQQS